MDDEDFLAAVEADNAGVPVEEPKEAKAEETPLELTEEAPPEAPAEPIEPEAPVVEAKPDPGFVPITALLDVRDRAQKAEQLAAQREAELAQFRAQQQPQEVPDRWSDEYEAYQDAKFQNAFVNLTLNTSERFARKEHGTETVDAAKQWALSRFASDPLYQQQVLGDADPYERVVADYRKDQLFSQISDPSEIAQFQAWKAAQTAIQNPAPPNAAAPPDTPRTPPPRSLASAPSAGGVMTEVEQTDQEAFEEVIPKR